MIFSSLDALAAWRRNAAIADVVAINGCFDIIHPGHVSLFEWAFFECWAGPIIVGINSDSSVRALKGAGRPVNGAMHRAKVLQGLKYVFGVVVFDELTPVEFLRVLRPGVWVVGGGYDLETVDQKSLGQVARDEGAIRFAPFMEGYSSSQVVERVMARAGNPDAPRPYARAAAEAGRISK